VLTVGSAKLSDERRKAFELGGIICVIQGDKVRRVWHGVGDGRDLMVAEILAEDGSRWVMGRVRVHKDDKMFDSNDEKHSIALGIGSEVEGADEIAMKLIAAGAMMLGGDIVEFDAGLCGFDGLQKLIESITYATGGRMSSVERKWSAP